MEKFASSSLEESRKIAKDFAKRILAERRAENGALVLALTGDLGSGKTVFAQAFAEALGVKEKIKSPTFIIFRRSKIENKKWQDGGFENFYHFDVYRIHNEKEILNLGWEEIISNPKNIVLAEWADKIEKILPKNCVKIMFKHLRGDKREITIS
ncbi:MAG: tRNA (adenosine(37)-N6)-threonylcarbamoyltransferase complex ATPase subunit type 1 TsaE [Patescibacteria group bacterium]